MSVRTPIYNGLAQSDLDMAWFDLLNWSGGGGGGGSGLPPGTINIKDAPYNAAGNGVTDDTAALQSAIVNLTALGGGRIYFPPGTYLIGGALQEPSGRNAQILLPIVGTSSPPVTIELHGALAPPTQYYFTETLQDTAYSIIKSTLTGASGTAAFIAGKEGPGGNDWWGNVQLVVRDLILQAPPNPSFTMLNCQNIMGPRIEHVLIHTGALNLNTVVQPTHTNAVAIKCAPSSHSAAQRISYADVWGFYTGLQDGELAESHLNMWGCVIGVLVPFNFHLSTYRHLGLFHCAYGIKAAGVGYIGGFGDDGTHYMRVYACALEHSNSGGGTGQAWQDRVYDVDDASNLLTGDIKQLSILAGVGRDLSFTKNGGVKLLVTQIGEDAVYVGPDARLVSISGGVKLEVRNAGTGVWVEATRYTNP